MGVVSCGTTMLDQGLFENIGAVSWDTTPKTSTFTGVSGNGYFVNTTSGAVTVNLPSSPSAGDVVAVSDYAGTAGTNNITIGRNGSNINGSAANLTIENTDSAITLVYVDGTQGWKATNTSSLADVELQPEYITATGGTITTVDTNFKVHTFTGPGTFTVCSVGNPKGSSSVDYMVAAGGGGGGRNAGGGGGAGGWRASNGTASGCYSAGPGPLTSPVSGLPVAAQGYPITVGSGGAGASGGDAATGSNSIFSTITSTGGGRAGGRGGTASGGNGASGGGAAGDNTNAGSGNTPPTTPAQGTNGGTSSSGATGAGGGGAAVAGTNTTPGQNGGAGGAGATTSITGSPVMYAAGGGGGGYPCSPAEFGGAGGGSGGGCGADTPAGGDNVDGTANKATGGGGGSNQSPRHSGSNGGSGVVIIRYKFQ